MFRKCLLGCIVAGLTAAAGSLPAYSVAAWEASYWGG